MQHGAALHRNRGRLWVGLLRQFIGLRVRVVFVPGCSVLQLLCVLLWYYIVRRCRCPPIVGNSAYTMSK